MATSLFLEFTPKGVGGVKQTMAPVDNIAACFSVFVSMSVFNLRFLKRH
jgi:hypothetical protein